MNTPIKCFCFLMCGCGLVVVLQHCLVGQEPNLDRASIISARQVNILDDHGSVVGSIGAAAGGYPGISISIMDNLSGASILATKEGLVVLVSGPGKGASAGLVLEKDGQAFVELANTTGKSRAALGIDGMLKPFLKLVDKDGKPVKQ